MSETFAERLKRLRQDAGLTQRDVAERCGCSNIVSRALAEACTDHKPSYERSAKLATALGFSLAQVIAANGREGTAKLAALHRAIQIGSSREQLLAMMLRDA